MLWLKEKQIRGLWIALILMVLMTTGVFADEKILPQVKTLPADTITHETAIVRGSYVAGTDGVRERGFKVKAVDGLDGEEKTYQVPGEQTVTRFGYTLRELQDETAYEVVAYVKTADETIEGETITFKTEKAPAVEVSEPGVQPETGDNGKQTALSAWMVLSLALATVVLVKNNRKGLVE